MGLTKPFDCQQSMRAGKRINEIGTQISTLFIDNFMATILRKAVNMQATAWLPFAKNKRALELNAKFRRRDTTGYTINAIFASQTSLGITSI
jgi:hypothetical protein